MRDYTFIIAFQEHRIFQYQAVPLLVYKEAEKEFFTSTKQILEEDIAYYDYDFSENEKEIIRIANEYNDSSLLKIFSKVKSISEFHAFISETLLKERIRPYIEKRIFEILDLGTQGGIDFYLKPHREPQLYESARLKVETIAAETVFNFEKGEDYFRYFLSAVHDGKEVFLNRATGTIICNSPCLLAFARRLFRFNDIDGKKLLPFFSKTHIDIPLSAEKKYFETFVFNAVKAYKVNSMGFEIVEKRELPNVKISLEKDWKDAPVLLLKFYYGKWELMHSNKNMVYVQMKTEELDGKTSYTFVKYIRDIDFEEKQIEKLKEKGLVDENQSIFKKQKYTSDRFEEQQHELIEWLSLNREILTNEGFILVQDFFKKTYFTGEVSLDVKVKKDEDWFDVRAKVRFGDYYVSFLKLKNHILNHRREYVLPNGEVAILPEEWFSEYEDYFLVGKEIMGNFQIPVNQFNNFVDDENFKPVRHQFTDLLRNNDKLFAPPENVDAKLRSYQQLGFSWLYSLKSFNFGGCLADDMGLGKTIQTISLLVKVIGENNVNAPKKSAPVQLSLFDEPTVESPKVHSVLPSLIIMPTSLVFNWENEFCKFAPSVSHKKYVGQNRLKKKSFFKNTDVVFSTYGVVRNDVDFLSKLEFLYVILDEGQYIKNHESKLYKAVQQLNAQHRIVLTGTPIENSLSDLWAQMNFLNEGILGSYTDFKNRFQMPIERQNDEEKEEKLKQLIHPFFLRRTKSEVAPDLPPLNEHIRYCTMYDDHRTFYEEEKSKIRNHLLEVIEDSEVEKNSILVIQALTRLRLIANHPVLADTEKEYISAKFEEVTNDLKNLVSEKHKVLIFSSFVKHLNLFENYFKSQNLKYSKLIGSTTNRKQVIDDFNSDNENFLFLISLKAGGTGLNLTSADYVIILDPWWNPAAEMQAISRAHRIGQDKKVFVYRYITKNSIEEKINRFQQRKSKLADTFINSNNPFKDISEEQLKEFFD